VKRLNRNGYPRKEARREGQGALPHRLPLQDHQQLGWQLRQAEEALQAIADTLAATYGRSAEVTRYTRDVLGRLGTLRGTLARELDGEHPLTTAAVRQACYAPVEGEGA
jgi:hypothetical protein